MAGSGWKPTTVLLPSSAQEDFNGTMKSGHRTFGEGGRHLQGAPNKIAKYSSATSSTRSGASSRGFVRLECASISTWLTQPERSGFPVPRCARTSSCWRSTASSSRSKRTAVESLCSTKTRPETMRISGIFKATCGASARGLTVGASLKAHSSLNRTPATCSWSPMRARTRFFRDSDGATRRLGSLRGSRTGLLRYVSGLNRRNKKCGQRGRNLCQSQSCGCLGRTLSVIHNSGIVSQIWESLREMHADRATTSDIIGLSL